MVKIEQKHAIASFGTLSLFTGSIYAAEGLDPGIAKENGFDFVDIDPVSSSVLGWFLIVAGMIMVSAAQSRSRVVSKEGFNTKPDVIY